MLCHMHLTAAQNSQPRTTPHATLAARKPHTP